MTTYPENRASHKLLGILSIPAWIYPLWVGFWKVIEIAEHITFIREYFPWLMQWVMKHVPTGIDWPVAALSAAWVLGLFFIVPAVAERWGAGWGFASVMVPVMIIAFIIGIYRGIDLKRENDAPHKSLATESLKNR